jgi:hypothetical protein
METISNDFGQSAPVIPRNTKPVAESYSSISVFDLHSHPASYERTFHIRRFTLGNTEVKLVKDPLAHDWYLQLLKPGPKCSNTTITLTKTRCNYGGYREWFECPKCLKRAGVLYREDDDFRCRPCLGLGYWSQKMSYRTLLPTIRRWARLNEMSAERSRRLYRGKPTRYARRYERLRGRVQFGLPIKTKST